MGTFDPNVTEEDTEGLTETNIDDFLDQSAPLRAASFGSRIVNLLKTWPGVYVPGWPGVVIAVERTSNTWSAPWIVITDRGSLFVDPFSQTITDALETDPLAGLQWPRVSDLASIEGAGSYPDGSAVEPDENGDAENVDTSTDPAYIAAGALIALAVLIRASR